MTQPTRGRIVLMASVLAAAGVGAFIITRDPAPGAGITQANFDRIAEGMAEGEVTEILGCPPGDYTGDGLPGFCDLQVIGRRRARWVGRQVMIELEFREANGRLVEKFLMRRHQPTWFN